MSQTDTTQEAHVSIREGDTFRDELNNESVEVLNIEGDVATVRSGEAEWRERVRDLREKVVAGDMTPTGDDISLSVESEADIPAPGSAQLLYPDEATAREVAGEMGLDGVHEHTLDGDTYWMPGDSHAAFEDATEQEGFADYESFEDCVRHNDEKDDPDAYCAAIMRQVKGAGEQRTPGAIAQKAEFQIGEQVMWEYQGNPVHGVVREVVDGSVSLDNGAERAEPQGDEMNYVIDEWDDTAGEYQRANVVKSGSELNESTADIPDSQINAEGIRLVPGGRNPVEQKAEFSEGAAVRWSWQGTPVHGRVAEVRPDQATVSGNTITGDEDESVYVIDEWDDRVEAYRRENVAKPESRLNESGKDLPPRSEGNYVNSEAWDSVTTVVSESDFTAPELDHIAREHPDVLYQGARPTEWALVAEDPVVYRADIPDKYLADRDESLFVPNAGAAENARKVDGWKDEHGDDVAGGAPDGEGARRGNQLIEYHDRGEPLAVEYWEEILNYHERHRAQGNHELDSEYEQTPWEDAGYVSNLNWGGDAGYEQAQQVMDHVESVDQELTVEMEGAVATEQSINRDTLTEADSNRVDLDALEGELREAVEADEFYIYGKASIEQWDSDDPPTHIQMDALEGALGRFFQSETAPGIISRHHQDIPVGVPVESFEFQSDTTLEIGDERYEFEAGDVATSHVEDADGDGRPELWLAANISNDNEMSKKTRVLAAQGDLDGFSVTVHRNEDEMTQEGRVVTDCDLHAVTIGTGDQIKNKGSQFDVASVSGKLRRVADVVRGIVTGD